MEATTTSDFKPTLEMRIALSRLLTKIWLAIDYNVLTEARQTSTYIDMSEYPMPASLTMHRSLGDAVQYLGLMAHGTIITPGVNGYSLQEIVGVARHLVQSRYADGNDDVEMDDVSVPDNVLYIQHKLRIVLAELEAGVEPIEPIATVRLVGHVNASGSHSHLGSQTSKVSPAVSASPPAIAPGSDGSPPHLSPSAQSHARNWVQNTARSRLNIPSTPSLGPLLSSDSYASPVDSSDCLPVKGTPIAVSNSSTEGLSIESYRTAPTSANRASGGPITPISPGPILLRDDCSLPLYNDSSNPSNASFPYNHGGNCSIGPSESQSQYRHHYPGPRRMPRQGSLSPTLSNCSITPSESISVCKYDNAVQNHYTWAAHPYRNPLQEGEIVIGPRFIEDYPVIVVLLEEGPSEVASHTGWTWLENAAMEMWENYEEPEVHVPSSAEASPVPPENDPARIPSAGAEEPRLTLEMDALSEPIEGSLSEEDNMMKLFDKIDRTIDRLLAEKATTKAEQ